MKYIFLLLSLVLCGCHDIEKVRQAEQRKTNAPPGFRAVEYGESWNKHTYLIYDKYQWGAVLHAEHCRGYHPNFIIVTNITYVTVTNTLTEIPDEVWKRYEELRRK